jgi:hypothetical protein
VNINSDDEYSYKGVISGWSNNEKLIYTSPVYMRKRLDIQGPITDQKLSEVLNTESPKRISKALTNEIEMIAPLYINALKECEKEFMSIFSNCMPLPISETP